MSGCQHETQDITLRRSNSMWGGTDAYCSACGHKWHMTDAEVAAFEYELTEPTPQTQGDIEAEEIP